MPGPVLETLLSNSRAVQNAAALFADCLDYGLGIDELDKSTKLVGTARELIFSGNEKLNATVELLLGRPPSPEVTQKAQFAAEMFLKGYIAARKGLTEKEARTISHDLDKALAVCLSITPHSDLRIIGPHLAVFPPIDARYKPGTRSLHQLWTAYSVAQCTGSSVVRELTGRDCRRGLSMP
jgi:hypothetical protein